MLEQESEQLQLNPRFKSLVEKLAPAVSKAAESCGNIHGMNVTFSKALVALVPACMLPAGSVVLFSRGRSLSSFVQLFGAACLVGVVLTHIFEALHLFPWMDWGMEHSLGHYLDLSGAVRGLAPFPIGSLSHALTKRTPRLTLRQSSLA
jgi:hypothetical protein